MEEHGASLPAECADCAARSLALETASVNVEESDVSAVVLLPASQIRCFVASGPVGAEVADDTDHASKLD